MLTYEPQGIIFEYFTISYTSSANPNPNLTNCTMSGESVDDCGGGYSESIAEMCDELQNGSVAILIQTPNGRDDSGSNRDCFLLNPSLKSSLHQNMFRFFGE